VPVLRPRLPSADRLLPYLRRIDAARVYSNWGPLSAELEARLAERLGLSAGGVVSAASGTAALAGAILATAGRATEARPLALLPAFTFIASAAAVEQCGYRPCLADVDAETWMLDPDRLAGLPDLDRVGVAVPVAAFGRPVPQEPWRRFRERTGIPVVVDGAAGFDRAVGSEGVVGGGAPVAFSFHATKAFATGEGGAVASTDPELAAATSQALNYGFRGTRESRSPSINGKMSEYHAAVGLAELDGWPDKLAALEGAGRRYRLAVGDEDLAARLVTAPEISASYVLLHCKSAEEARRVRAALARAGVDYRLWYGAGLHAHASFSGVRLEPLEVTDRLAERVIGLPLAPDLDEDAVGRVTAALRSAQR
jgi:dTDP-4-amino-4,6-dideoxygalactose transaminase